MKPRRRRGVGRERQNPEMGRRLDSPQQTQHGGIARKGRGGGAKCPPFPERRRDELGAAPVRQRRCSARAPARVPERRDPLSAINDERGHNALPLISISAPGLQRRSF